MVLPNTVPIPNFASAIPIPASQPSSSTAGSISNSGQSSNSRRSKDNQNGVFNPPRRTFTVPATTDDVEMYEQVRKIIHQRHNDMKPEPSSGTSTPSKNIININRNKASEQSKRIEKLRLELHVKSLKKQKQDVQITLEQAQQAATKAQQDLLQAIKDRDQELQTAKNSPDQLRDDALLKDMKKEKEELLAKIGIMEEGLKESEEVWNRRIEETKQQLDQEAEEKKRKAVEQMEEQRKKRQRLDEDKNESTEISETQRLEQELKDKEKELEKQNQAHSQMIWLMKQVIKLQNEQKEASKRKEKN